MGDKQSVSITNKSNAAADSWQWDSDTIISNDAKTKLIAISADKKLYAASSTKCGGGIVIALAAPGANSGKEYILFDKDTFGGSDASKDPILGKYFQTEKQCFIKESQDVKIGGQQGQQSTNVAIATATALGASAPSCESNFNSGFEWIMCPGLRLADKAASGFGNFVEGQMTICTGQSATNPADYCANNLLDDQVKQAWNIFKYISSALLVIVMLVMVFAQATGSERIDPYTVRKALPKLVIAVILIQFSWDLMKLAIDVSNDLGKGIQDLLYAPFGGAGNMHLDKLLSSAAQTNTSTGNTEWGLFVVLAGGVAAIANIPGLLVLAFYVVMAIAVAFFVLLLRKILIILLVILAPLAFIAWILPGTERYWKLWSQNFSKLLIMFPLIMAMVAAGRIFAYIVAIGVADKPQAAMTNAHAAIAQSGNLPAAHFADITTFASLAIVIIAFFAPYLLFPKAFSWGGQLMSGAVNAVNQGSAKFGKKASEGLKGFADTAYTGKMAKKYNPNDKNLARKTFFRVASGHYLPTERSRRQTIYKGDEWAKARTDEAEAYRNRIYEKAVSGGYEKASFDEQKGEFYKLRHHPQYPGWYVDKNGNTTANEREGREYVGLDATKADHVKMPAGVEAGKQALMDIMGNEGSDPVDRASQAAARMLLDTHSEIELQGSRIQGGVNSGKRASEVTAWNHALENSPTHYSAANASRPDFAPDVKEGAEKKVKSTYKEAYQIADPAKRAEKVQQLDIARLSEAIKRMSPEGLSKAHYGMFDDISRMNDRDLSNQLLTMLTKFKQSGQAGELALGALRGGKESHVDDALRILGTDLKSVMGATAAATP